MNVRIPLALACSASFFSMIQPLPAFAQTDQPGATNSGALEEIVVTARRKEEKLQTVPVAITAFTPAGLEEKHIEIDGQRASASLIDFALYMTASARKQIDKGKGPYFYQIGRAHV